MAGKGDKNRSNPHSPEWSENYDRAFRKKKIKNHFCAVGYNHIDSDGTSFKCPDCTYPRFKEAE